LTHKLSRFLFLAKAPSVKRTLANNFIYSSINKNSAGIALPLDNHRKIGWILDLSENGEKTLANG
jgi:hypothetical protein